LRRGESGFAQDRAANALRMTRKHLFGLVLAAACAVPTSTTPSGVTIVPRHGTRSLRRAIDSVVNAPEFANGHWGVLVINTRGDTLYSHNAGKLFMPASNQKILTSAVAFTQLGPDYRYRTSFVAHGAIEGGVLNGDLGIVGRGDPSISDHMRGDAMQPLLDIADSLAARGIHRIRGKVIAEGNAFPDPVLGFGWSWSDLEDDYSAPTDELLFNEGVTNIIVWAGARAGDSVRVETRPTTNWPRLRVSAVTVAPVAMPADTTQPRPPRPQITIVKDTLTGDVLVGGTIVTDRVDTLAVTHRDPDLAYVAAFREALTIKGIAIGDEAVPPATADTVLTMTSPSLREILPPFLKPSQNQIGEMLFKTIGLERGTAGTAGTAAAARVVVEKQLDDWGAIPAGYVIRDGSGLSRYDYVSPETIVHVLDAMRRDTAFLAYYDAFPIAGVDGTIRTRMRGTPAAANVRAKTGSVAQARSLSGYVRALDGDTLIFSILANNWNVPASRVTSAADSIAARLASYRR
jgi:D-alanyl-D-alanine carboxypeptidase/D-alanyl-D-alanine-endopeptidase (penicillin-binding protein 4)